MQVEEQSFQGSPQICDTGNHNFCNTTNWNLVFGSSDTYESDLSHKIHKSTLEHTFRNKLWVDIGKFVQQKSDGVCFQKG